MSEQLSFVRRFLRSKQGMAGLLIVVLNIGLACFASRIAPYDFDEMDFGAMLAEPGTEGHCLGTDDMGRDVLTRLIYGSQVVVRIDPDWEPSPFEWRDVFGVTFEQRRNDAAVDPAVFDRPVTRLRDIPEAARRDLTH